MNGIDDLRANWGWILTFGALMVLLGMFAVAYSFVSTLVSVFWLGWVLIVAGVIEGVNTIRHHGGGHMLWHILEAVLAIAAGVLLLSSPGLGALTLTLMLAAYLVVAGIFRIVAATTLRLPNWGWTLFNGILTVALGIMVWSGWPGTAFWIIGMFVGISLIFAGWARIMLALALRHGTGHGPLHPLPV